MSERLQQRVGVPGGLSVTAPAADDRQPAAGVGRSKEAGEDVPEPEHPGAGQ